MNTRRVRNNWIIAILILILLGIWIRKHNPTPPNAPSSASGIAQPDVKRSNDQGVMQRQSGTPVEGNASNSRNGSVSPGSNPRESRFEEMREGLSTLNDVAIVFYGKLEDQFGNPVVNAEITGSIIYDNGMTSGVREAHTTSDSDGVFKLEDKKGESLSVTPAKSGYVVASTNAGFRYSHFYPEVRHVPDPSNPVVIKMWKFQGAEELEKIERQYKLHFTETPVYLI